MALSDPKTVTINAVANSLARIPSNSLNSSVYSKDDGNVKMTVSQSYGKRKSVLVRFDFQKVAADPLISSTNIIYSMSVSFVINRPLTGYTIAEQKLNVEGALSFLTAASGADLTKVLGGES